jgi:hypothetical protein
VGEQATKCRVIMTIMGGEVLEEEDFQCGLMPLVWMRHRGWGADIFFGVIPRKE